MDRYYKVEFSHTRDGKRVKEFDETYRECAQDAVDAVRGWYNDLNNLRIEQVWRDNGNNWVVTTAWE